MRALSASLGGLVAMLLVPLALSGTTAWMLLPAHLALTGLALVGTVVEGLQGWPARARLWGAAYVVATAAMIAALSLGAGVRDEGLGYYGAPWIAALLWGWPVPLVSALAGAFGERRRRQRNLSALRRRRMARPSSGAA